MKNHPIPTLLALTFALGVHGCQAPAEDEASDSASSAIDGRVSAKVFGTGGQGLRVRSGPSTSNAVIGAVSDGQSVTILCQTRGQMIGSTDIWDRIDSPRGYVSDAYVWTGYNGFHPSIPRCDESSTPAGSDGDEPSTSSAGSTTSRGFSSIWGGFSAPVVSGFNESNGQPLYDYGRAYGLDGIAHTGVDVGIVAGTKLYAPKAGKIVCVGWSGSSPDGSSCGYFQDTGGGIGRIQISLDDGSQLILGHCRSAVVSVGQRVEAGQQVGTSGGMNGDHVHVEMRVRGGNTSSGWLLVDPRTRL